jgi:hypothetical protein
LLDWVNAYLSTYFEAAPKPPAWENVEGLENLTSGIELFHTPIGLERYDDARVVFQDHLARATLYRLRRSWTDAAIGLCNLPMALLLSGHRRAAATAVCRALVHCRDERDPFQEGMSLYQAGLIFGASGPASRSTVPLYRSLKIMVAQNAAKPKASLTPNLDP